MSCPKCEPSRGSRRWLWWLGLAAALAAGAWLQHGDPAARGHDARANSP